jgi:transcriptional regulator with GAF, ATPase, and Fis domain
VFLLPQDGCDIEEVETDLIRQALDRSGGNAGRAAKLVGLTTRMLEARMQRLGL